MIMPYYYGIRGQCDFPERIGISRTKQWVSRLQCACKFVSTTDYLLRAFSYPAKHKIALREALSRAMFFSVLSKSRTAIPENLSFSKGA